jgi:uncharacterized membrane protein YjfL (UPF0719 family)
MASSDLLVLFAGLLAYGVAITLGAGPLVYLALVLDTALTKQLDEEGEINKGNLPIAIELGTTILCQAILVRHAVYAAMAIIRSLFVEDLSRGESAWIILGSLVSMAVIAILALASVHVAGAIFKRFAKLELRRKPVMNIDEAIRKRRNVAMAVFYGLVLLAITVVLNEGMEDFSRSLIPYGRAGLIEAP